MPLHQQIIFFEDIKVLIWKIEESIDTFKTNMLLKPESEVRMNNMKSEVHQKGFLSIRKLLSIAGYSDFDLNYDENGKPHLKDGKCISISHSHHFSCIAIGNQSIGIDLEMNRYKILKIANKFDTLDLSELNTFNQEDFIKKATVIWGVKEAIFKICNQKGISFKNHIRLIPFLLEEKKGTAIWEYSEISKSFTFQFEFIENFSLIVALES